MLCFLSSLPLLSLPFPHDLRPVLILYLCHCLPRKLIHSQHGALLEFMVQSPLPLAFLSLLSKRDTLLSFSKVSRWVCPFHNETHTISVCAFARDQLGWSAFQLGEQSCLVAASAPLISLKMSSYLPYLSN